MNTCKDCKFWTSPSSQKWLVNRGDCSNPKFLNANENPKAQSDSLYYWDYEGYSCGFNVGPDFGCIHWAAK